MNLHYHCVFLDGVYTRGADGRLSFRQVTPHTADVERLVVEIAQASEAWLGKQGYGPEEEIDPEGDDAQAVLQQASLLGQAALGPRAGRRARRVQVLQTGWGRPDGGLTAAVRSLRRVHPGPPDRV